MSEIPNTEDLVKLVEILSPLTPESRKRLIMASLTLLGDGALTNDISSNIVQKVEHDRSTIQTENTAQALSPKANIWLKQSEISPQKLENVFHFNEDGTVDIIAAKIPGKTVKERVANAYILVGVSQLLTSGMPVVDDKFARNFCDLHGLYNHTNHSKALKGNWITGTKDKGWNITTPGLQRAAEVIKEISEGT